MRAARPGTAEPAPRPWPSSVRTNDVDEARSICESFYYPLALKPLGSCAEFSFQLDVRQLGPITVGTVRFGAEVEVKNGDLESAYHVSMPIAGYAESRHRNHTVLACTTRAAVYQPVGDIVMRWGPDCQMLAIKIDRPALDDEMQCMLGHAAETPLRLGPSFDVARGAGHCWSQLMHLLYRDLSDDDGLARQPFIAERLSRSILCGLLLVVDHQHRDRVTAPAKRSGRNPVARVLDAMHENPTHPFTTNELAKIAGVGSRALQQGFQRHVGLPPMVYLRQVRLDRARDELRQSLPPGTTVADVAHRWGLGHLGRFAAAYRARFGVTPSQARHGRP